MIPLKYNVRNLRVRWKTTLMTVLGTGLVVWSSCILFGLVEGLEHSLTISGDPLDLIVMRKGSSTETTGGFETSKADDVITFAGNPRDDEGQPVAAKELLNIPIAERANGTKTNIIVRGVQPASRMLRPDFKIVAGGDFVDRARRVHRQPENVRALQRSPGRRQVRLRRQEMYKVVGVFTAGGSAAESEVWADLKDVEKNTGREGSVSCVQIRAASPDGYRPAPRIPSTTTCVQAGGHPRAGLFRDPEPFGHLPEGGGHHDRRAPDLRRHVLLGQHHVCRRQRPNPRNRHVAGPRILAV